MAIAEVEYRKKRLPLRKCICPCVAVVRARIIPERIDIAPAQVVVGLVAVTGVVPRQL